MHTLDTMSEALLRRSWDEAILRRGEGLLHQVLNPLRRGDTLEARVGDGEVYGVRLKISPRQMLASCSCPRGRSELCAHTAALALAWIRSPAQFTDTEVVDQNGLSLELRLVDPPPTREPEEPPFWMTITQDELDALYRREMAYLLEDVSIRDLREAAEQRGWKARGIRKDRVVEQVVDHLALPEETGKAIEKQDAEHRQVLCGLVLLGYPRRAWDDQLEALAELWGQLKSHKWVDTYTRHLVETGLAVSGETEDDGFKDSVPRPLARWLPPILNADLGLWPLPRGRSTAPGEAAASVPEHGVAVADPYRFVEAVLRILLSLEETPSLLRPPQPRPVIEAQMPGLVGWDYDPEELAQARREGRLRRGCDLPLTVPPPAPVLPDEAIERLAPLAGDDERLNFIISLLQAASILQPGSPITPWSPAKAAFFQLAPMRQRAVLTRTYFRMLSWSELWRMLRDDRFPFRLRRDATHEFCDRNQLRSKLATLRWLLLRVLGSFPDGHWVEMADLDRLMRLLWPRFERSAWDDFQLPSYGSRPHLVDRESDAVPNYEQPGVWDQIQGRFIRGMLTGPLHWLGLADLAFDGAQLTHVRFYGLGDLYWDRAEAPPASPHAPAASAAKGGEGAFSAEGLTVSVRPGALSGRGHGLLNAIARLQSTSPDRFEYRLDGAACLEAFDAGTTLSNIIETWEEHLPAPMPDTIGDQLTDWWEGYGRLRLYEDVTVIEFSDEYALAEMKAITSLEEHLVAEVSSRLVVIPEGAVDCLVEELREAGHTPQTVSSVDPEEGAW